MKLWVGDELEGKFKGLKTLFIGTDDILLSTIKNILDEYEIKQLYFGAGMCQDINYKLLNYFLENDSDLIITAEVDYKKLNIQKEKNLKVWEHENLNLILTFNETLDFILNKKNVSVKMQDINNGVLFISDLKDSEFTKLNDLEGKKYSNDIKIR